MKDTSLYKHNMNIIQSNHVKNRSRIDIQCDTVIQSNTEATHLHFCGLMMSPGQAVS